MSNKWLEYEKEKRKLLEQNLDSETYEKRIKQILKKLKL